VSPLLFRRLSDEILGSRLASGEAAAFDELYRRYAHRLAAYGSHLLGDAAAGDDVAQAAMLKAYGALRDGRVPDKLKPWLYRIAHNAAIDLVARRRELSTDTLPEQASGEREPFAGALVEALATLPDRQRRVYVLREVHGLRIDETAAELGLSAAQVEQSLFAARNRLAEQLVFGDRLNCVTVQRLAAGPLDGPERRALKTHLRACRECRQTMGLRGRALSVLPSGAGLEWLRGLGAGLLGGAPAAAKVGAIFATATLVGGGTAAVERTNHRPVGHAVLHVVRAATVMPHARAAPPAEVAVQVAVVSAPARTAVARRDATSGDGDSRAKEHEAQQVAEHDTSTHDAELRNAEPRDVTAHGDGEHGLSPASSSEHSGRSSETRTTAAQPAETQTVASQSAEPQDSSEGQTTTTTTTTVDPAALSSDPAVVVPLGD
jgi:RNA polymerase sigma factor (sigma-70 family)